MVERQKLTQELGHPDASVRNEAVHMLAEEGIASLPGLSSVFSNENYVAWVEACKALSIIAMKEWNNEEFRETVLSITSKLKERNEKTIEISGYTDPRKSVFDTFKSLLSEEGMKALGSANSISQTMKNLYTHQYLPNVPQNAGSYMSGLPFTYSDFRIKSKFELVDLLKREMAQTLAFCGKSAIDALIIMMEEKDVEAKITIIQALGNIKDTSTIPYLIQALNDDEIGLHSWAADALGKFGDLSSISDPQERIRKCELLRNSVIPALVRALGDDSQNHLWGAEVAIKKFGTLAIPSLTEALSDANPNVRRKAAIIVGELMDTAPIPELINLLIDDNVHVRVNAAIALENISKQETAIALDEAEQMFLEGYAALHKNNRNHNELPNAVLMISKSMNEIAKKKNSLVSKRDLLLDDIPKPQKKGGMFKTLDPRHKTISGSARRSVLNG